MLVRVAAMAVAQDYTFAITISYYIINLRKFINLEKIV